MDDQQQGSTGRPGQGDIVMGKKSNLWLLGVDRGLMAHNQSINLEINVSCSTVMRQVQWIHSII